MLDKQLNIKFVKLNYVFYLSFTSYQKFIQGNNDGDYKYFVEYLMFER